MRREVFEATKGWDEGMLLRGGVDNEGCVRFWLLGYELWIAPDDPGCQVLDHARRCGPADAVGDRRLTNADDTFVSEELDDHRVQFACSD